MDNQINVKNHTKRYVIWTYAVFWIGILFAVGLYLLSNSELVMSLSTIPLSWVPTIVLFVMFNKLISNASRKEWLKENNVPYDKLIVNAENKAVAAKQENLDINL